MNNTCKVFIIGRLGSDPTIRSYKSGTGEMAMFSVAVNSKHRGEVKTEWHNVRVFGKQVENCKQYLHKGDMCCVEGRLEQQEYEKDGKQHRVSLVIADRVSFLGKSTRTELQQETKTPEMAVPF